MLLGSKHEHSNLQSFFPTVPEGASAKRSYVVAFLAQIKVNLVQVGSGVTAIGILQHHYKIQSNYRYVNLVP